MGKVKRAKQVPLGGSFGGRGALPSPGLLQEVLACGLLTALGEAPQWEGGRQKHYDIKAGSKRIQVKSSAASSQQFDPTPGNELPAISVTLSKAPRSSEVDEFLLVVLPFALRNNKASAVLEPTATITPTDSGFDLSMSARVVVDKSIEVWRLPTNLVGGPQSLFQHAFARSGPNKGARTNGMTLQAKRSRLEEHPDVTQYLFG